jgi:histidinol-phosphate phosphatase family protein
MQAVILAGGRGTRLCQALGMDIPKPMVPVLGVPLLERTVRLLKEQGFARVLMLVQHRAEVIQTYFGNGLQIGIPIHYAEETTPRGTAGALIDARSQLEPEFVVLYGDTLVDLDLRRMLDWHAAKNASLTLFAQPNDHMHDSDLIEVDSDWQVKALLQYPHPPGCENRNLVNAALYVMRRALLNGNWPEGSIDLAKHAIPRWLREGMSIYAYRGDGYIKDMGTPERLENVERELRCGTVDRKSGRSPRSAVFLDRDGTLNREKGHLVRPDELELFSGIGHAIQSLNRAGIPAIVITNQPVVARGEADFDDIASIHRRLENLLAREGAYLDAIFFCPHHPDSGFAGERPELKIKCNCRKPATGLVEKACEIFNINLPASWFIGDSNRDLECAERAGIKPVLVLTGPSGNDLKCSVRPAFTAPNVPSAIKVILKQLGLGEISATKKIPDHQ